MNSGTVRVAQPGLQTTVQDYPGRVGHWRVGIPPSGPMDSLAFRLANLLVGNDPGAPALEFQFVGPTLEFGAAALIALTGGDCAPSVNGNSIPMWQSTFVTKAQILNCRALRTGARAYMAIAGGIEKARVLGSCATFPRGGIGGGPIEAGATLRFGESPGDPVQRHVRADLIPNYPREIPVEVTAGPHLDWLDDPGIALFLSAPWKVTGQSDRTGIRLDGPKVSFSDRATNKAPEHGQDPTNVINTGYPVGGVNLCGDTPIILPVDGPSQGGFITPFVVPSGALWKVGQARPGQILQFHLVDVREAIVLRCALDERASRGSLMTEQKVV